MRMMTVAQVSKRTGVSVRTLHHYDQIGLLNADFSAYKQLSAVDLLPVIVIALVSFLIKAGVLSAVVIDIKELWEWIRKR